TRRWVSLPKGSALRINAEGEFEFPVGTIIVQQHAVVVTGVPFETQVLWFTGPRSVRAAAYRWNPAGNDADLIEDGEIITLPGDSVRHWFSPGTEESLNLDLVVAGFLLPVSPRQFTREQITDWNARGWLNPKLTTSQLDALPRLAALDDSRAPAE